MGTTSKVVSAAPVGFDGRLVEVECDVTNGLPAIKIVGLANRSVDEAKERIKSAITNSLLDYPAKHITINLAPAELPKDGTHYDLPIAVAVLVCSGQLRAQEVAQSAFAGELILSGELRPVPGIISIAESVRSAGVTTLFVPIANLAQARLVEGIEIVGVTSLKELFLHLKNEHKITSVTLHPPIEAPEEKQDQPTATLDDIEGQEQAKRAIIIAAAGRHNILLSGPPGAGKTMLGRALTGILPRLTSEERLAITKIHSLAGESIDHTIVVRPFRSPHHTSSRIALIGGGTNPKPGEVSLAHLGVLFLDEIPEYPRSTLESLRQPLEDHTITIARANARAEYPADFMLVATMNPCPCGHLGDPERECTCSINQIANYQKRLSGPLLDRIDLKLSVPRVPNRVLFIHNASSNAQQLSAQELVNNASDIQLNRYGSSYLHNANLTNSLIKRYANETSAARELLLKAAEKMSLSARATFKTLKVARTIADLEASTTITPAHISEALQYR